MKVLELFAGTRSIGKAFEARGHEVFSVDWGLEFANIDLHADIMTVTAEDILQLFGRPSVIWASPDCTTYSVAAIGHHRKKDEHGNLVPQTEYAKFCDRVNQHVLCLILALSPKYWFIENPRGGAPEHGFHERAPALHGHILQIRRYEDEADRYLYKSSRPEIYSSMQERRHLSRSRASRIPERDASLERKSRTGHHSGEALRAYRRYL